MKVQPVPERTKPPEDRFKELGRKIMSVPKAEVERREAEWKRSRKSTKRKRAE